MRLFLRLRDEGQTIFMVTHDAALAAQADRVVNLRDGRLSSRERVPALA
jgi:predicted ABC-type transport system involved in lysophospholipase L1 biosynthesis ATPase subunit